MITPYEEITCVYRKAHMIVMQVILDLRLPSYLMSEWYALILTICCHNKR
jgi:hypothetical protein